ncbi:glycosyltransferase family 2 protein [Azohydromonas lata]|uniref:glycosyltransferase family 2 protein n=1 Tax=Azohydromonas lata TaxID=45677 RepID=UPI0009FD5F30|nr:glycosyltransferase family 2 protein [Azohydromonas lata]
MNPPQGPAPVFSIITAVYNAAPTLEATLRSIAAQLGSDVEYIVIDGGSSDGSVDLIKQYSSSLAYWTSEPDKGIYNAWNKGLKRAKGQYIGFIGADDTVNDNYLSAYRKAVLDAPDVEYWSSRVQFASQPPRLIGRPWKWSEFQRYMAVAHVGSMHKRSLFERYGHYDESFRITADYEFLLRPGASLRAGFIDAITVTMGAGGTSTQNALKALRETRRAKLMTGARLPAAAHMDYWWAYSKYMLRRAVTQAPGETAKNH